LFKKILLNAILLLILVISTSWIIDKNEEEISEFNGKLTNFIRGNGFNLRKFNKHGIPISSFGRTGIKAVSPFYVVHYGLIYSDSIPHPEKYEYLWNKNASTKYWNIPPDKKFINKNNFFYACDWVAEHIKQNKYGKYHLEYNFDWYYKHLSGKWLKAPWYSGLTDGFALTLLSRAYILTNDTKYKNAAEKLYSSVISYKNVGGDTITFKNGDLWIEEYVVKRLPDTMQPRVLNGMIYASFGVNDYEKTFKIKNKLYPIYFKSIRNNINRFDLGYWTSYDLIGTVANYKYHHVHLGLLQDLFKITNDTYYLKLYDKWKKYNTSFLLRHFYYTKPTVNSLMTLIEYVLLILLIQSIILIILKKYIKYRRKK